MIKMNRKYTDKTFDECFRDFLLEHCTLQNMREDTKKYYIENMKYGFYKYYDKDTNISEFTQEDINGYILYLQKKSIKDTTINIYLKALKTIIIFYKKKFWIDKNITVMLVKEDKQQIEGYTDRHWYAKKAVMNGVNIVQLQHLLGHSNLEILKHYVEMLTQDLNYKDVTQNPLESIKLENSKGKNIKLKK